MDLDLDEIDLYRCVSTGYTTDDIGALEFEVCYECLKKYGIS